MKGTIYDDKNTIRLPRQDIPGKAKNLKIRHFLCFSLSFTNDLPIFLESWTCENYDQNEEIEND